MARWLGVSLAEYERYERGVIPPPDVLVRLCERTGEDFQWLLTGVPARGAVALSGWGGDHQELLVRIARALRADPSLAPSLEAFVDLLLAGRRPSPAAQPLAEPTARLIPVLVGAAAPACLPGPDADARPALSGERLEAAATRRVGIFEPSVGYDGTPAQTFPLLSVPRDDGPAAEFLQCDPLGRLFPHAFAVRIETDEMQPMFAPGDAALVEPATPARIGRPALVRLVDQSGVRCRIWLGIREAHANLGRLRDGESELVAAENLGWSLEVLFRVAAA